MGPDHEQSESHTAFGLVLDCADPERLAEFWAEALGYANVGSAGVYVALYPRQGTGPKLLLQRVTEPKATKNRMGREVFAGDPLLARLVKVDIDSWFLLNPAMLDLLADARQKGMRLTLLSNARLALTAGEVIFVDDRAENLSAAAGVGLRTFHYSSVDTLADRLGTCATATGPEAPEHHS